MLRLRINNYSMVRWLRQPQPRDMASQPDEPSTTVMGTWNTNRRQIFHPKRTCAKRHRKWVTHNYLHLPPGSCRWTNRLSWRNNRLKFKTWGNVPILLVCFILFLRQKADMPMSSFWQVERRFHARESNRQPLPQDMGISPASSSSLRSSRTIYRSS